MKPCNKIKQFIPLAVSQDLSKPELVLLNQHLQGCPDCRAELASYQELRQKMLAVSQAERIAAGELTESAVFWNNYTEKVMVAVKRGESIAPHLKTSQPYLFLKFTRAAAVLLIGLTIGYSVSFTLFPKSSVVNERLPEGNDSASHQSGPFLENEILKAKFTPVSPALSNHLQITPNQGLVLTDFLKQSPAKEMGLECGDILIELNGQPITSTGLFNYLKEPFKEPAELKIIRKGKINVIKIKLRDGH